MPHYEKKIWDSIIHGRTKNEIIHSGIPEASVDQFFKDWYWKIEQLTSIKKTVTSEIRDPLDKELRKSENALFTCPRCSLKVSRSEIKQHLDHNHPIKSFPSIDAEEKEWKEYFYDSIRGHAQYKYVNNRLIYTPMKG